MDNILLVRNFGFNVFFILANKKLKGDLINLERFKITDVKKTTIYEHGAGNFCFSIRSQCF